MQLPIMAQPAETSITGKMVGLWYSQSSEGPIFSNTYFSILILASTSMNSHFYMTIAQFFGGKCNAKIDTNFPIFFLKLGRCAKTRCDLEPCAKTRCDLERC